MASTHQSKDLGNDSRAVWWSDVTTGIIVAVHQATNTADVNISGVGQINGVPIFYHCEGMDNVGDGYKAFIEDDEVLILIEKDSKEGLPDYTIVGFSSGDLQTCFTDTYLYIEVSFQDTSFCSVYNPYTKRVADRIPMDAGGFAVFPCDPALIQDWLDSSSIDSGFPLFHESGLDQTTGAWDGGGSASCPIGNSSDSTHGDRDRIIYDVNGGLLSVTDTSDDACSRTENADPGFRTTRCCIRNPGDCSYCPGVFKNHIASSSSTRTSFDRWWGSSCIIARHIPGTNYNWFYHFGRKLEFRNGYSGYTGHSISWDRVETDETNTFDEETELGSLVADLCTAIPFGHDDGYPLVRWDQDVANTKTDELFENMTVEFLFGSFSFPDLYNEKDTTWSSKSRSVPGTYEAIGAKVKSEWGSYYVQEGALIGKFGTGSKYMINNTRPENSAVIQYYISPHYETVKTTYEVLPPDSSSWSWVVTNTETIKYPLKVYAAVDFPVSPGENPTDRIASFDPSSQTRDSKFEAWIQDTALFAIGQGNPSGYAHLGVNIQVITRE